jgi:hydroxymethylglutaryl-CoA synthase
MKSGIVSYGTYIPKFRVKISEIAGFWQRDSSSVVKSLGLEEKSVPAIDEDSVTMAVESSSIALSPIDSITDIEAVLVGSESHPYAVKPTATTVAEILGITKNYLGADTQFACKAGTAAMQLVAGLIESKQIKKGLIIGSDTAQAKPGDALEYTAASAAASFVLGFENVIARILDFTSYSTNTPDFWRRDGQKYPSHGGRFTGGPAYFDHVLNASATILKKTKLSPSDFSHAVFHMPNSKFPKDAAKRLGFTSEQLRTGLVVESIGNPYSASSLLGLAAVLDVAKPGEKIFVCSYGSGSGSDAFVFEATDNIVNYQKNLKNKVISQIKSKKLISYPEFVKLFKSKEYI